MNTPRTEQPQFSLPSEASAMLLRVGVLFVIAGLILALAFGLLLAAVGGVLIAGGGIALAIAMESVATKESVDLGDTNERRESDMNT